MSLLHQLRRLELLRGSVEEAQRTEREAQSPAQMLLQLCASGALDGALSIALDLRPDELIGPLLVAMGGRAPRLRVLDVRERPQPQLNAELDGRSFRWKTRDVTELVRRLNELFKEDLEARAVALLGEWEDMRQLWCIPKAVLPHLLKEPDFQPLNRVQLTSAARAWDQRR